MDLDRFKKLPLMGILRGVAKIDIVPLVETVVDAGLETLEVTMNTPGAPELIKETSRIAAGRLMVGAGTVLSKEGFDAAFDAGASFIVTPVYIDEVVNACREKNIPFFPGALTPTEVYKAHQAGAAMVKVFPAGRFSPKYFKELKGPLGDIKLMAVGGVRNENIKEYFDSGADAVAFGASVFQKHLIEYLNLDSLNLA